MLSPDQNILHLLRGSAALELAKQGKKIFPLIPGSKTPAIAGWVKLATTDSVQIIKWWNERDYNIGILTGDSDIPGQQYIMLDYDMKAGQRGEAMLRQHTLLGLSDTESVKTPHGVHKTYLAPKGLHIKNSVSTIATNVDVRGWHGYVVGPGSIVDGVLYTWDESNQPAIAQLPQEFIDLALAGGADKKTNEQRKTPLGELDQAAAVTLAIDYLENYAPLAVEGAGGDQTTYRVAAHVKDLGISEGMCLELLMDHYNETKCFPAWAYDALRTKVQNAYKYGQSAPGSKNPYVEFGVGNNGSDDPQTQQKTGLYRIGYRKRIARVGKSHGKPLIKGLIHRNTLTVMYGPSNSGKTFVAMDIAYAVGTGLPWNSRKTTKGLVVYVAAEGGSGVNDRTAALDTARKPASDPLFDVVPCPIDLLRGNGPDSHASKLVALIREAEKEYGEPCALLVIDTLSRALAGGEENSSVDMGMFIKHLDQIRAATGTAVLVIHHSGKDIARGARGWSGVQAAIDTEIEINQNRFAVTKQRDLPTIDELSFRLDPVTVGSDEDGDDITSCTLLWGAAAEFEVELTPAEERLFGVLTASSLNVFTVSELQTHLAGLKDPEHVTMATRDESVLRQWLEALAAKRGSSVRKLKRRGQWEYVAPTTPNK